MKPVSRTHLKALALCLLCSMLLVLTACSAAVTSSVPSADSSTAQSALVTNPAPVANPEPALDPKEAILPSTATVITPDQTASTSNVPDITEIASDYLSGAGLLTDHYHKIESNWIEIDYDVELGSPYHRICPAAVFPEDAWTPESVLQSYFDQTANWVANYDLAATDRYYLWSADYDYMFTIEDGWLEVNLVKSIPFDCETCSDLSPLALLKEYQSGAWNGEDWLWSEDYSTYVQAGYDNTLEYVYNNPMTPDKPREYAYSGCAANPWWNGLDEFQGFAIHAGSSSQTHASATVFCYLDLPDGKIDEGIVGPLVEIDNPSEVGSWLTTETGVYHYLQGKLLDSWRLQINPTPEEDSILASESFLAIQNSWNSFTSNYTYTGSQLVELLPGGKVKVILDDAVADTSRESVFWVYFVEDRSLKRWQNWGGDIKITTLIENDVIRIVGTSPIFVEKADGYIYAFNDDRYSHKQPIPTYVGDKALDYYTSKWDEYHSADHYKLNEFAAEYGETGFPPSELKSLNVATASFGQRVEIRPGAIYYASADLAGSGASAEVYNAYTEGRLYLGGFALAKDGRLADHEAYLRDYVQYAKPAPDFCRDTNGELWCFVFVDGFTNGSIGWFRADDIYYVGPSDPCIITRPKDLPKPDDFDPDLQGNGDNVSVPTNPPALDDKPDPVFEDRTETTSGEVASNIEELATSGKKVAVLLDASGSVSKYSASIANYATQVDTADTVIMFGGSAKDITAGTYAEESSKFIWNIPFFGAGASTNVFAALNTVPVDNGYDTVILVSDLLSTKSKLNERSDISNVVIIFVGEADDMNNLDPLAQNVVDAITANWGVTPVLQQLVAE